MSSNSVSGDSENPFSFKSFVLKKEKVGEVTRKEETAVPQPMTMLAYKDNPSVSKVSDQNPFSYKKFVEKTKTVTPSTTHNPKSLSLLSESDSSFSSDEALDTNDDCLIEEDNKLITLSDSIHVDPLHCLTVSNKPLSTVPGIDDEGVNNPIGDKEISSIKSVNPLSSNVVDNTQILLELKNCREENDKLVKTLYTCEQNLLDEKRKNKSLAREVKALKKKELSETKALEEMVAKVEKNLAVANKRSVVAESTISTLRSEIEKLQNELATAKNPQVIHQTYQDLIFGVREKANYASQQLTIASHRADLQIRELCQGIEALKLVSEVLLNIDSSFEVKCSDNS